MKFAIPTYQRSEKVRTIPYLHDKCGIPYSDIVVCVQDKEDEKRYREKFPECQFSYRPGQNAAMNRNNALNFLRTHYPGEDFIIFDDDIEYILILRKEGNRKTAIYEPLVGEEFLQVMQKFFDYSRTKRVKVWGMGALDNPFFMRIKIAENSLMTGQLVAFVNGGGNILMDESYYMKEDYEMLLRMWQSGEKTLKFCMIAPRTNNRAPGGCTESRKKYTEKEFADRLLSQYPELICRNPKKPGEIKSLI